MTTTPPRRRAPQPQHGFTLLELLVTLALACLLALFVLPCFAPGGSAIELGLDARVLAAQLRAAREIALATRESTTVIIDLAPPRVRGPGADAGHRLHAVQTISVRTAKGLVASGQAVIVFMPDGKSTGGDITLLHGGQRRLVQVAWLTGLVRIGTPP